MIILGGVGWFHLYNSHCGQVSKLIKEWEKHGVGAAFCGAPCEPVDLIFPENEVQRINKVKGDFKHKTLAVELAAALLLDEKINFPTAAAKLIMDTFNITVTVGRSIFTEVY